MTKVITREQTDEMSQYRLDDLHYTFPELKPEDFADDNAYRAALLEQYRELRRQEFRYVVSNEAMKAYNVASEANADKKHRVENTTNGAWGGYKQKAGARDSSFVYVPEMVKTGDTPNQGESCAISANALVLKISNEMGYTGKNNLIVPKSRIVTDKNGKAVGVSPKNNLSAAAYIHLQDSIPKQYRISFENKKNPTLNDAIKKGIVGIGDEISLVTGKASETTSGCHAMVIVDVQKDASGKVVNYTLQCNNPPCLKTVDANNPDYYGKRPLNSAVSVSRWIDDKIYKEIPDNMNATELAEKVAQTNEQVSQVVDKLHSTEAHYAEKKHYNDMVPVGRSDGFGEHYNANLDNARAVAETRAEEKAQEGAISNLEENTAPVAENTNTNANANTDTNTAPTAKKKVAEDMKQTNGELAEDKKDRDGSTVALKGGRVDGAVTYNDAKKDLDKKDERTAKEAMREGNRELEATQKNKAVAAKPQKSKLGFTLTPVAKKEVKVEEQPKDSTNNTKKTQQKTMSVQQIQAYLQRRQNRK